MGGTKTSRRSNRDPVWLISSLLAAFGACFGVIIAAYNQTEPLGRILSGATCLVAAWTSGVAWLRYRLGR